MNYRNYFSCYKNVWGAIVKKIIKLAKAKNGRVRVKITLYEANQEEERNALLYIDIERFGIGGETIDDYEARFEAPDININNLLAALEEYNPVLREEEEGKYILFVTL